MLGVGASRASPVGEYRREIAVELCKPYERSIKRPAMQMFLDLQNTIETIDRAISDEQKSRCAAP
jgi:hypothetical protein